MGKSAGGFHMAVSPAGMVAVLREDAPGGTPAVDISPDGGSTWESYVLPAGPGISFAALGCNAAALYRGSLDSLSDRSKLATMFPLPPYLVADVVPGMTDPDPFVLHDTGRPLVCYSLATPSGLTFENALRLTIAGDAIRIDW